MIATSGCGGSSGGGGSSKPGEVTMKNTRFDPGNTTVEVGDKVTWTNDDAFDHNVVASSGADFKSENFGQDQTFSFTPARAGTIKYRCTLHPGMNGTLKVTAK